LSWPRPCRINVLSCVLSLMAYLRHHQILCLRGS
jgi:hypothetical protein